MIIDPKLTEWATVRQIEIIDALAKHGGFAAAARSMNLMPATLKSSMAGLNARAARSGYSPDHDMRKAVPDGYKVAGVSNYYDLDGKLKGQWVKSSIDKDRQHELMLATVEALSKTIPKAEPIKPPKGTIAQLANVYTLTDSHVGMLTSEKYNCDKNGNWDLKIAEKTLVGCFISMVNNAAPAEVGIVAQLGDFLHSDGMQAVTPTSGHLVDQDGRFPMVVSTAIRILRTVVDFALTKHKHVVVLLAEGNHDLSSSIWLRAMFQALYEKEKRVSIINSELPYYVYQHGETMLAWHHGHLSKNDQLPILFASQFPKVWGTTVKRYAHTGHRHHLEVKEHSGITVTQHSTLASRDAYASRGGWMSERQATTYTYHKQFGLVSSVTVTPEMLG